MLKRYMDRENHVSESAAEVSSVMEMAVVVVIEKSDSTPDEVVGDNGLLDFVVPGGKETPADVCLGDSPSEGERAQAREVI